MLLFIKLYGGLICGNPYLPCYGLKKFQLEVPAGSRLEDLHRVLCLKPSMNLVSIVNGHAESSEYRLNTNAAVSIFLPMADRQYDLFSKTK